MDRQHGTERALAELIERLARNYRCEVHLFAQRVEGVAVEKYEGARARKDGAVYWHRIPRVPGPHIFQFLAWFQLNRVWRAIFCWRHRVKFDCVLSPGINCSDANVVIVHALFHRLRELAAERDRASVEQAGFLRRVHRRAYYALLTGLERRIYSDPRIRLAGVSERTVGLLGQYFQRPDAVVILNGVDGVHFSPAARLARRARTRADHGFKENEFVLLLIGNDWTVKGLPVIFEAMAVCKELPLRLVVVGSDVRGAHQLHAKSLGIQERCQWTDSGGDALAFYAAADAYVSPTLEDAFALPPLEAMSSGLPVITSRNNGGSQIITNGENGFVLQDAGDVAALVKIIIRLVTDADYRGVVGAAAARTTMEMTWDRNALAVWSLLQKAVDASTAK